MPTITSAEYRNALKNLLVDYLGVQWAVRHLFMPFGGLNKVPAEALPALYAQAQADAHAMAAGMAEAA